MLLRASRRIDGALDLVTTRTNAMQSKNSRFGREPDEAGSAPSDYVRGTPDV